MRPQLLNNPFVEAAPQPITAMACKRHNSDPSAVLGRSVWNIDRHGAAKCPRRNEEGVAEHSTGLSHGNLFIFHISVKSQGCSLLLGSLLLMLQCMTISGMQGYILKASNCCPLRLGGASPYMRNRCFLSNCQCMIWQARSESLCLSRFP